MNRLMALLLALCSALLGMLVLAVILVAGSDAARPHPSFAPMLTGVDAGELGPPRWAICAAGLLVMGTLWVAMLTGLRARHWIRRAVSVWMMAYLLIYLALLWSFEAYADGAVRYVFGFTAPAAVLVYGLTLAPWIPLGLVTWKFGEAYFGPAEAAQLQALLTDSATDLRGSQDAGEPGARAADSGRALEVGGGRRKEAGGGRRVEAGRRKEVGGGRRMEAGDGRPAEDRERATGGENAPVGGNGASSGGTPVSESGGDARPGEG